MTIAPTKFGLAYGSARFDIQNGVQNVADFIKTIPGKPTGNHQSDTSNLKRIAAIRELLGQIAEHCDNWE